MSEAAEPGRAAGGPTGGSADGQARRNPTLLRSTGSMAVPTLISRITGFVKLVLVVAVLGPAVGMLATRYPERRIHMAFGIVATVSALWALVILWPGHAPLWLIVALVIGIAANGPGGALSIVPISQLSFLNRNGQPTNGN